MALAVAGEQRAGDLGIAALAVEHDLAIEPRVATAGGERRGDQARAFAERRLVGQADEAGCRRGCGD